MKSHYSKAFYNTPHIWTIKVIKICMLPKHRLYSREKICASLRPHYPQVTTAVLFCLPLSSFSTMLNNAGRGYRAEGNEPL